MYPCSVNDYTACPSFSNKLKGKVNEESEGDDESDLDYETLLSTVILD
jgi:hypothetical protein